MAKYDFLQEGENFIDKWTINYKYSGSTFNGILYVTDKRLLYNANFRLSVGGVLQELAFINSGSTEYLEIKKEDIENIEVKSKFFKKQVLVTTKKNQVHTFDYGMLSVDKLAKAIES